MKKLTKRQIEKLLAWLDRKEQTIMLREGETVWYDGNYYVNKTERLYIDGVPAPWKL